MKIEYSQFITYCRCPKAYKYAYVENLEPILVKKYFTLGKAFHTAIQSYYKGEDWKLHIDNSFNEYKKEKKDYLTTESLQRLDKDKGLLHLMVRRYIDFMFFYNLEYMSGENKYSMSIDTDILMWGRPDLIVHNSGQTELIELKTVSSIGKSYRDYLRMSPQSTWYSIITGIPIVRYVLNRKATKSSMPYVEDLVIEPTERQKNRLIENIKAISGKLAFPNDICFYPNISILCNTCQFNDLCLCESNKDEEEVKKALYQQKKEE